MSEFMPWPSIKQFKDAVKLITSTTRFTAGGLVRDAELPVLAFHGTVKIHGTNAAIRLNADGTTQYQSRNRDITVENDHMGFAEEMSKPESGVERIRAYLPKGKDAVVFGEWFGGNIQQGVAVSGLPKRFCIFGLSIDGVVQNSSSVSSIIPGTDVIANIYQFGRVPVIVDMNDSRAVAEFRNKTVELMKSVEAECPVGKFYGQSGIGEGMVWRCITPGYESIVFKVKGEEHTSSRVATLTEIDPESVKSRVGFAAAATPVRRLEQGVEYLKEMGIPLERASTGKFIKWVMGDVAKEDGEALELIGLRMCDVSGEIGKIASKWFFEQLEKMEG